MIKAVIYRTSGECLTVPK